MAAPPASRQLRASLHSCALHSLHTSHSQAPRWSRATDSRGWRACAVRLVPTWPAARLKLGAALLADGQPLLAAAAFSCSACLAAAAQIPDQDWYGIRIYTGPVTPTSRLCFCLCMLVHQPWHTLQCSSRCSEDDCSLHTRHASCAIGIPPPWGALAGRVVLWRKRARR